jgi:sporulenol synthase
MIILLRTLEINDEDLIKALVERIESKQQDNGAWKLFYDEGDGSLTATVEAYYALLYSGYRKKNDKNMQVAKQRILEIGWDKEGLVSEKMKFFPLYLLSRMSRFIIK